MTSPEIIVVTNDDGPFSNGLRAAAETALQFGKVLIAAPRSRQTCMGRSFPQYQSQGTLELLPHPFGSNLSEHYAVEGSPAQAVAHGILELACKKPALCISGFNDGENLGGTCLVSGTVGAALEAASHGVPAIAASIGPEGQSLFQHPYRENMWDVAKSTVSKIAQQLLSTDQLFRGTVININIPANATHHTPVLITHQSTHDHFSCVSPGKRDFSVPCRLPTVELDAFSETDVDSDIYAFFHHQAISVTPMSRNLTTSNNDQFERIRRIVDKL